MDVTFTKQMMNLLRIAIYNISYIRGLFPEQYFRDISVPELEMTIKKLIPKDVESRRLIDWIDEGVNDAMQKKYLETVHFCICEKDEGAPIEDYSFIFNYPNASCEEVAMEFSLDGSEGTSHMFKSNPAESTGNQIRRLIRISAAMMSTLDQLPNERTVLIKLMYHDDVTPEDYEPPLFECCHDDADYTDLIQSFGRLCCISQRAPTLLLDSAATHHIFCDKSYMTKMKKISKDKRIELSAADGAKFKAKKTGSIDIGNIHLSQVRYIPEMKFNLVSIGYLDKQGLLITIVNSEIFVTDVSRAILIGEGYRHRKNNDYVLKAMKGKVENEEVELQWKESENDDSESWVIDTCCASHMAGSLDALTNPKPFRKEFSTPHATMTASHKGSVRTANVKLSNVLYCPANTNNLISVGVLDSQGYRFTFYKGLCTIVCKDTLEEVGRGMLQDNNLLYYLQTLHTKNMIPKRKRKTLRRNKFD